MILEIIIASLFVICIHALMLPGSLFSYMGCLFETLFPVWMNKPLHTCLFCMTSIWGTAYFILFIRQFELLFYFKFILALGGLNYLVSIMHEFIVMSISKMIFNERDSSST